MAQGAVQAIPQSNQAPAPRQRRQSPQEAATATAASRHPPGRRRGAPLRPRAHPPRSAACPAAASARCGAGPASRQASEVRTCAHTARGTCGQGGRSLPCYITLQDLPGRGFQAPRWRCGPRCPGWRGRCRARGWWWQWGSGRVDEGRTGQLTGWSAGLVGRRGWVGARDRCRCATVRQRTHSRLPLTCKKSPVAFRPFTTGSCTLVPSSRHHSVSRVISCSGVESSSQMPLTRRSACQTEEGEPREV